MLSDLARDLNPDRPGRYEPRVVKRRPKQFPRMQQPRQVLRKKLRHGLMALSGDERTTRSCCLT